MAMWGLALIYIAMAARPEAMAMSGQ